MSQKAIDIRAARLAIMAHDVFLDLEKVAGHMTVPHVCPTELYLLVDAFRSRVKRHCAATQRIVPASGTVIERNDRRAAAVVRSLADEIGGAASSLLKELGPIARCARRLGADREMTLDEVRIDLEMIQTAAEKVGHLRP
jgi:hypothetical protein